MGERGGCGGSGDLDRGGVGGGGRGGVEGCGWAFWRCFLCAASRPRKYVAETGVDQDPAAVELAQKVMALLDGPGSQAGTYVVDARYAQRFQIGQRNIQFG